MTSAGPLFTIDEPHSRDLDDAICVERAGDGWRVTIAIANPSLEVAIDSEADLRARGLGATLYRGRSATEPMLPREISEARSTLAAGMARQAMLIHLQIDRAGQVLHADVSLDEVVVSRRLAYSDVPRIALDGADELNTPISNAIGLASQLLQIRRARGALAIYDQKRMLLTDEEGRIRQHAPDTMVGHIVVQEFMIAANAAVAELAATREIPFLFRTHEPRISAPRGVAATESFEAWMAGGVDSIAAASQRLNLVVKKARYSSELRGHYGLNLPAYAHVTSPLRRYSDLVDQRQLVAHVLGRPLPYTQHELEAIGQELFDLTAAQAEDTSNHFKAPEIERAMAALGSGGALPLSSLADNELGQAVKAAIEGSSFVPPLIEELLRRLGHGLLADKVVVRLIEGKDRIPKELAAGLAELVHARPHSAVSFLNHAKGVGAITTLEVTTEGVPGRSGAPSCEFEASANLHEPGGQVYHSRGRGSRKKDAEQGALVLAFCDFLGAPRSAAHVTDGVEQAPPAATWREAPDGNPKGALFELSQKMGLAAPAFETTASGPANASVFTCVCKFDWRGSMLQAQSEPATTKKAAEGLAARGMLEQVGQRSLPRTSVAPETAPGPAPAPVAESRPSEAAHGNPISQLQELVQKKRLATPNYSFEELAKTPNSSYRCRLLVDLAGRVLDVQATASTKQAAKTAAAAAALTQLSGPAWVPAAEVLPGD
ncbi:MAG: RNB domain-containing ribonuclease [Variovorax sp.]